MTHKRERVVYWFSIQNPLHLLYMTQKIVHSHRHRQRIATEDIAARARLSIDASILYPYSTLTTNKHCIYTDNQAHPRGRCTRGRVHRHGRVHRPRGRAGAYIMLYKPVLGCHGILLLSDTSLNCLLWYIMIINRI
jgi:hypothetical protein